MENSDTFVLAYGGVMFMTVVILSLFGLELIDIYLGVFALELFITSEFAPPLLATESRRRTIVGLVMIVIFIGAILKRAMHLLGISA